MIEVSGPFQRISEGEKEIFDHLTNIDESNWNPSSYSSYKLRYTQTEEKDLVYQLNFICNEFTSKFVKHKFTFYR